MRSHFVPLAFFGCLATVAGQSSADCYSGVRVILARGTFEPQNDSLAETVSKAIVAAIPDSYADEVIYPANATFNVSIAEGVANGMAQIYDYAASCPDSKIVAMGYSQGAQVIGNVLWGGGSLDLDGVATALNPPICPEVAKQIIAVIQFGDPGRVESVGFNADIDGPACNVSGPLPRTGAELGNMTLYSDKLAEWCNYSDFVCCATGTTFAGHLSYYTSENAATIAEYVYGKYNTTNLATSSLTRRLAEDPTASQIACARHRLSPSPSSGSSSTASVGPSATGNSTTFKFPSPK